MSPPSPMSRTQEPGIQSRKVIFPGFSRSKCLSHEPPKVGSVGDATQSGGDSGGTAWKGGSKALSPEVGAHGDTSPCQHRQLWLVAGEVSPSRCCCACTWGPNSPRLLGDRAPFISKARQPPDGCFVSCSSGYWAWTSCRCGSRGCGIRVPAVSVVPALLAPSQRPQGTWQPRQHTLSVPTGSSPLSTSFCLKGTIE